MGRVHQLWVACVIPCAWTQGCRWYRLLCACSPPALLRAVVVSSTHSSSSPLSPSPPSHRIAGVQTIKLESLGDSITTAVLLSWNKHPGKCPPEVPDPRGQDTYTSPTPVRVPAPAPAPAQIAAAVPSEPEASVRGLLYACMHGMVSARAVHVGIARGL